MMTDLTAATETVTGQQAQTVSGQLKNIIEAAILAVDKPISVEKMLTLFPESGRPEKQEIINAVEQLQQEYSGRGIELVEVSSGYRFQVCKEIAPWVARLWEEKPQKYSRALLETLALVAYRQPVTRGEIEDIRGVSVSSHIIKTLVEREWIRIVGHRDVPGKPAMYATTRQFLDYFGLKKLEELPPLSELRDFELINAELDFGDNPEPESRPEGDGDNAQRADDDKAESSDVNQIDSASENHANETVKVGDPS